MLMALAGLVGLVFAGAVADAALSMARGDDEACDDGLPDEDREDREQVAGSGAEDGAQMSLLDWAGADDDEAQDAAEAPGNRDGTDGGADNPVAGPGEDDAPDGPEGDGTIVGEAADAGVADAADANGLRGGDGNDSLSGGAGRDSLAGHGGDDRLDGGPGDDTLIGGPGRDLLIGGEGHDWLAGGWGDDALIGGAGADTLDGGAGDDRLEGAGDGTGDFLNGGDGDDHLILGAGDRASGGDGNDSYEIAERGGAGPVARIDDFDAATEQIMVVYDPAEHPEPEVSLQPLADGTGTVVLLDGLPVAELPGVLALPAEAIVLSAEPRMVAA